MHSFAVDFNYLILAYLRFNYLRLIYVQFWCHYLTAILLFLVLGCIIITRKCFKPGVHSQRASTPGFLKLLWSACRYACVCVCVCVCVCPCVHVCPPPRPLITSHVIWCDIGRVWLVKQVIQLFPGFNYFIRHLLSITWMDVAILTQHVMNACQTKVRRYYSTTQRQVYIHVHVNLQVL